MAGSYSPAHTPEAGRSQARTPESHTSLSSPALTSDMITDDRGGAVVHGVQLAAVGARIRWLRLGLGQGGRCPLVHHALRSVLPNLDPSSRGHRPGEFRGRGKYRDKKITGLSGGDGSPVYWSGCRVRKGSLAATPSRSWVMGNVRQGSHGPGGSEFKGYRGWRAPPCKRCNQSGLQKCDAS